MVDSVSHSTVDKKVNDRIHSRNSGPLAQPDEQSNTDTLTTAERLQSNRSPLDQFRSTPTPLESLVNDDPGGPGRDKQLTSSVTVDDATSSAVDNAAGVAGSGAVSIEDGFEALQVDQAFNQLNSDGDKLYMRMTGELKGSLQIGFKGQLGADIEVTRIGDGADADYRITLDKESLAALTGKISIPYVPPKLEAGLQTADRVEMTFDTQDEAIRATRLLQRLVVADVASGAAGTAGTASGDGVNPVANPLTESGAPGMVTTAAVGVTDSDLAFLQSHITAYEQKLGLRGRVALEVQAPQLFLPFKAGAEGRIDPRLEVIRRIELPQAGNPGELTYTVAGDVRVSAKEKIATDPLPTNQFDAAILVQNRLEVGTARMEISAHYDLALDDMTTSPVGGRPVPEYDLAQGYQLGVPDKISVETTAEWRVQGLTDLSRGDTNKTVARFEITDMDNASSALGILADGDIRGASAAAGAEMSTSFQQIERSGFALQSGFKLKVFEGNELEATVILEAGVDDIISTQYSSIASGTTEPATATDPVTEAAPTDDGNTLVVVPREGVLLRDGPLGTDTTAIQHGTFMKQTGQAVTAFDGSQWVPVSGTDVNDQPVSGYIHAGLLKAHDSSQGAMDETGRTNPTLEYQRYDEITVKDGDNLWDLARQHEVSFDEMVALNRDHLIAPDLIFAGDTVYLPGTEKGPLTTPESPTSTTTDQSSDPSATTAPGEAATPVPDTQQSGRSTDEILREYQVADDIKLPEWNLNAFTIPFTDVGVSLPFTKLHDITKTEGELIQQLYDSEGIMGPIALYKFDNIVSSTGTNTEVNAFRVADQYFPRVDDQGMPIPGVNDGHNDAFRHVFYNAMLTKEFGVEFAAAFGTAHEGLPGNPADREAMDLYNNELGREIAVNNPDASPKELAELIHSAIMRGEALVIDRGNELVFSNEEAIGHTGKADDAPVNGVMAPPAWNTESN